MHIKYCTSNILITEYSPSLGDDEDISDCSTIIYDTDDDDNVEVWPQSTSLTPAQRLRTERRGQFRTHPNTHQVSSHFPISSQTNQEESLPSTSRCIFVPKPSPVPTLPSYDDFPFDPSPKYESIFPEIL
ncbi:uncharacterized protein LOC117180394 [Belonocnema kinseyi]|uniref:uncharacterized protein LOC117180394 n=1 Tax=Belonocnema kinseyi TaxID=2817044 RepID=UPI00143E03A8|nr:uncharacterized protein LOC117180394 [Belonocnema kinseyi]